jgi:hypothetical protein
MQIKDEFLTKIGPMKILNKSAADTHAKDMIKLLDITLYRSRANSGQPFGR